MKKICGGVTAAIGFKAAGVRCGIKEKGEDLALIVSDKNCSVAGVFTTNAFKAAPVVLAKNKLNKVPARAIVINSGNANACTGQKGLSDAERISNKAAELLNISADAVYTASTGIIGVLLPVEKIENGLYDAVRELSYDGNDAAARAIMTTDLVPKTSAYEFEIGQKTVKIGGICKGSGMIAPNMATMLCFITTDAAIDGRSLQKALSSCVERTFNCLTVDGDTSTNDTVMVLANGLSGCEIREGSNDFVVFENALAKVCLDLTKAIAMDGEGATKYVEVKVCGASNYDDAKAVAMSVAKSSLVKTAIFGEDPNWGRVLCAVGYSGAEVDPSKTTLYFGEVKIVENGEPTHVSAETARKPMLEKELTIRVELGLGEAEATAFTCDFSYDYVKINAEYHT